MAAKAPLASPTLTGTPAAPTASVGTNTTQLATTAFVLATKLDTVAAPTDVTTLNATTSQHGLLPKLGGGTTNFLRADGTWSAPAGGGSFTFTNRLSFLTSADYSIVPATADTWTEIIPNQNFTVGDATSTILAQVGGVIIGGGAGAIVASQSRITIDSAGTPQSFLIGGTVSASGAYTNVLAGSIQIPITGLSAATHTIKIEVKALTISGTNFYCRSAGGYEYARIVVSECKP